MVRVFPIHERQRVRAVIALAWVTALVSSSPIIAQDDPAIEAGRLTGEAYRLIRALSDRGMPELVAEAVKNQPAPFRIHVARAYRQAAATTHTDSVRRDFLIASEREYRHLIARDPGTTAERSEWIEFHFAECRVELADLLLKHRLAPELDRLEMTSGLAGDRKALDAGLDEVIDLNRRAGQGLFRLMDAKRLTEERFMLLGLTQPLRALGQAQRTGLAWAQLYRATVTEADPAARAARANEALAAFDALSRESDDANERLGALIGKGIALRELAAWQEAEAVLKRAVDSPAPMDLSVRAQHELGRVLLAAGKWDAARRVFGALAKAPVNQGDSGGAFYIRLAPVLHAWSWMVEARAMIRDRTAGGSDQSGSSIARAPSETFETLRDHAIEEMENVARRGPAWEALARVYLERIVPATAEPETLSDASLRLAAEERLARGDFARAETLLNVLVERRLDPSTRDAAMFHLALCQYKLGRPRDALSLFEKIGDGSDDLVAAQSIEQAYRIARELALAGRRPEDCRVLARASQRLATRLPKHDLAEEARYSAALALQETGDWEGAVAAFARIPPSSSYHLGAIRGIAACRQRLFDQSRETGDASLQSVGKEAAAAWLAYAEASPPDKPTEDSRQARLVAGRILSSDGVAAFDEALVALAPLESEIDVLALRWRCLQKLGRNLEASQVMQKILSTPIRPGAGDVVKSLLDDMGDEITRYDVAGQREKAAQLAGDGVRLAERLTGLCLSQPEYRALEDVARFAWARFLADAGRADEALSQLEQLMRRAPQRGDFIAWSARLYEARAESADASQRERLADRAEALWGRLLEDTALRDVNPVLYWQARYCWLRHQLRRGRARDVVRGIASERAWYPDLGGPPWQARLLELHDEARRLCEVSAP